MLQISNKIYCDDFIAGLKLETRLMPTPYYDYPYLIIKGFMPPSLCREIAEQTRRDSEAEIARVKTTLLHSVVDPKVDESIRKTVIHAMPPAFADAYDLSFKAHQRQIEDYFHIALTTATEVQVLEYTEGSFYIKHADDSNELVDADGATVGFVQVAPQRKLTTVLFGTSYSDAVDDGHHFSGGALCFNYLFDENGEPVCIHPEAGDMVIFPSNPIYSHEVHPVSGGYRLTLVQWHNGLIA